MTIPCFTGLLLPKFSTYYKIQETSTYQNYCAFLIHFLFFIFFYTADHFYNGHGFINCDGPNIAVHGGAGLKQAYGLHKFVKVHISLQYENRLSMTNITAITVLQDLMSCGSHMCICTECLRRCRCLC